MTNLSPEELKRYSRHLILPEVGLKGQEKLKQGSILLIGAGGLGCPLAIYLAAAGVGKIGIVDFDTINFSNLQRQILYTTSDVGKFKVEVAKERIIAMNPNIQVTTYTTPFKSDNAIQISKDYDILIDGTDNFPTRYLVNDLAVLTKKTNIFGSIFRFDGQVTVFDAQHGPCYRCLYPEPPPPGMVPSCAEGGVLGILPGVVGVMQATEAIKLIIGVGNLLIGKLLIFDSLQMGFRELKTRKDPNCPICSPNPSIDHLIDYEEFCGVQVVPEDDTKITEDEIIAGQLNRLLETDKNKIFLLDVRNPQEWDICHIHGSHLIPLSELDARINEIPLDKHIVTICHSGMRSRKAANLLKDQQFKQVNSLQGGVEEWAVKIDPNMARY